jgi:CxxC motif-containing protein (DUF1111 family)
MKSSILRSLLLLPTLMGVGVTMAQSPLSSATPPPGRPHHQHVGPPPRAGGRLGDPLPELTQDQLTDFLNGLNQFETVQTPASGLGPIFNQTSCANCHASPTPGGSGTTLVTRFGASDGKGNFDPLTELGGSLLQSQAVDPAALEHIPAEANVIAQRQSMPLYGSGLIEAIPDQAIQALAQRTKPDGVAGRAAMVEDPVSGEMHVGRFGWKAQQATLLAFAAEAENDEMGITNQYFPDENAPNGNEQLVTQFNQATNEPNDVADSTGKTEAQHLADYLRYLAPPPLPHPTAEFQAGLAVFNRLGCAECHVPALYTGSNSIKALDHKPVALWSDLLLHDMGDLDDGIAQGAAQTNEMKTPPLWGLRWSAPYLHDGRAPTIADAITEHDGEGAASRDRFNKLSAAQQKQLIDFLNCL